jgi:predicted Zn finger-like uncharacterized protein
MFKVECVGCKAPYQVDERRVPAKGLQMRCPKCGTSFRVEPNAAASMAPAPPAPSPLETASAQSTLLGGGMSEAPALPSKFSPSASRDSLARTMIGMNIPTAGAAEAEPKPKKGVSFRMPRPGDASPAPSSPPVAPKPPDLDMFSKETKRELPAVLEADLPDVLASFDQSASLGQETPVSSRPPLELALQPKRELSEVTRPSQRAERLGEAVADLPQPLRGPGVRGRLANDAAQRTSEPTSASDEINLPLALGTGRGKPPAPPPPRAAQPSGAQPSAADLADLPQPVAAPGVPRVPPRRPRTAEPASAAATAAAESLADRSGSPHVPRRPPPRRREPARPAASANVVDLPARIDEHELDLPVVGSPAHAGGAAAAGALARKVPSVPAPAASFDELDLPEIVQGLRAPAQNDTPSLAPELPSLADADDDLPAVLGGELPTPSELGLPDLPAHDHAFGEVDLPTLTDVGLPGVVRGGETFGELDLPLIGGELPALPGAGLPAVGQALPALKQGDLPALGQALPALKQGDLPAVGEVLPALKQGDLPAVGEVLPALRQGDLPAVGQVLPALRQPDLPAVGQILPAIKQQGFADGEAMLDPISFPPDEPFEAGLAVDPFAEHGAQGLGYGEVDIGSDARAPIATADDMEFSAIPEDDGVPSPPRAAAAASAAVHLEGSEDAASTLEVAPSRPRPARASRKRLLVLGGVSLLVIAGGALALEPALGPFGIHVVSDRFNRDRYDQMLVSAVGAAQKGLGIDTLGAAKSAIERVDAASAEALRYEPLKAYAGYLRYWTVLRFGPLPEIEALAKASIDGLSPDSSDPQRMLAVAARSAVSAPATAKLELASLGTEPDALRLQGEFALSTGDLAAARLGFQALVDSGRGGAQGVFGLARVALAEKQLPAASELAHKVLELSPAHVGAKLVLLEVSAAGDGRNADDAGAETRRWVDEVTRALPQAAPAEAALAQTLLGELHLRYRRQGPAQKAFEEALQVTRKAPRALIGLGEVLQSAGRNAEALARFQAAAEASPGSLPAELGIAKSQLELGRVEEAKALLTRLGQQYPKDAEVTYWSGRVQQSLGSNQAALDAYRTAIELASGRPESLKSYLALAKLESDLGELALASKALSDAEAKLPPSAPLFKAFGEIALSQGQFAAALERFQSALHVDPADTHARFLGAVALTRLGRFDEALQAFLRVSESDKDFPGLALERGRLYEESGRIEEALKEYEAALARAPTDLDLQVRVGCARVAAGRPGDADTLLQQVLKERPRSGEVYHCLGRSALLQKNRADALRLLERAVALDSSQATYHLYVGMVANEVGRTNAAEDEIERALELDKGLADAYWQRGVIRRKQGATKDAVRDLKRALELKPSRAEARAELALAYTDLGMRYEAVEAWERALAAQPDNALWLFRYGKLLGGDDSRRAAAPLAKAIQIASKPGAVNLEGGDNEPVAWLWQAHYLLARALGSGPDAVQNWQSYLRLSPPSDPYRSEAQERLRALGQPWDGP